jgi:ankyrin repeat protein
MLKLFLKIASQVVLALGFSSAMAGAYEDFFRAVEVDDARTVQNLLARGFDPNAPDERGQNGLFLALRGDAARVAAALLAHPDIRIDQPNRHEETPLMIAALHGRLDAARTLLDRGAQVNRDGWTPLHYAATGPEPKIVALLLDRGARIDAPSPNRTTPLMMAARYGTEDAVNLLLARGADPTVRNDLALNAADFARQVGRESLAARLAAAGR